MKAKIGNRSCEVEMISKDGNRVEISVDGKIYDIDVVMSESGFCSILHEGRSYNAEAVRHAEGKYTITTNFRYFDIELSNPQKRDMQGDDNRQRKRHRRPLPLPCRARSLK